MSLVFGQLEGVEVLGLGHRDPSARPVGIATRPDHDLDVGFVNSDLVHQIAQPADIQMYDVPRNVPWHFHLVGPVGTAATVRDLRQRDHAMALGHLKIAPSDASHVRDRGAGTWS